MYHSITKRAERPMKETLHQTSRHCRANDGKKNDRKATLHTDAVDKAVKFQERNVVLDGRPPPISSAEKGAPERKDLPSLN